MFCANRAEADRARDVVVSSRQWRAQEVSSWRGRQQQPAVPTDRSTDQSGGASGGRAAAAMSEAAEGAPGAGRRDADTLSKLLAYKTNEAAEAKAQLAELRAARCFDVLCMTISRAA